MTRQKLALLDFDGTLTKKDTLFEIIRFVHGKRNLYAGLCRLSPYLLLYKSGMIPNWKAKEKVLTHFFGNMPYDLFQKKCEQFARERLPALVRKNALDVLRQFNDEDVKVIIVSASAENWVLPWCIAQKFECVATRLETKNGKITGKISGKNCYGIEKVNRIRQAIDLSEYKTICVYGDSKGDKPMLALATHAHYRAFH